MYGKISSALLRGVKFGNDGDDMVLVQWAYFTPNIISLLFTWTWNVNFNIIMREAKQTKFNCKRPEENEAVEALNEKFVQHQCKQK